VEALESRDLPAPLIWLSGVSLPYARAAADAISLQGSNLFVLGGTVSGSSSTSVVNLNPSGTATSWASHSGDFGLPDPRTSLGVGTLPNGHILVFGGTGDAGSSVLDYDLGAGNPVSKQAMSTARSQLAYATDSNHPYAIGGRGGSGTVLASVERYDYSSNTWTTLSPLPLGHYAFTAVSDGNGHIYTFGGGTTTAASSVSADVYQYTIATDTWTAVAPMTVATRESTAVFGPNGKIYVVGGSDGSSTIATVQVYDPASNTWTTDTNLAVAVRDAAAAIDSLGRLDVIGGYDATGAPVANNYKTQRLNIPDAVPAITSSPVTTAPVLGSYVYQVTATGNPDPSFALTTAPDGMTMDSVTGRITWSPALGQLNTTYPVTVQASNSLGQATQTYNVTVRDTTPPSTPTNVQVTDIQPTSATLTWNPSTDDVAVAGYNVYQAVWHGYPHGGGYWTYGLRATATGTTVTVGGLNPLNTYTFTVTAFDTSNNQSGYSTPYLSVTTTSAPVISTNGQTSVVANHPISLQVFAAGNPSAITFSVVSGPAGLSINPNTGVVTWTPTGDQVGTNPVTFEATNAIGSTDLSLNLTVMPDLPVLSYQINPGGGPQYVVAGTPMTIQIIDYSLTPSTFSIVSAPATMTIDPVSGLMSWTPTLADVGNTTVHVRGTNAAGSTDLTFTFYTFVSTAVSDLTVRYVSPGLPNLSWTPPANSAGVTGYTVTVHYNVYTSTVWLTYNTSAATPNVNLTGITTDNVVIFITVTPTDAQGNQGVTNPELGFLYSSYEPNIGWTFNQPAVIAGEPASLQFTDYSGHPSTWSLVSGPSGMAIDANTGLLSWTPTLADVGTATATVRAVNGPFSSTVVVHIPVYFTGPVQNISATDDGTNINATWVAPSDNPANIVGYQVTLSWSINGQTFTATYTTPTADTTYAIPIPVFDTSIVYHLTVQAVDASGDLGAPTPTFDFTL
jgi:N-acetylneuraminic acid mutarotase